MIPGSLDATSDNALETRNLALNSTFVTQGNCRGIVFATGDRTVMGRLVRMSGETKFKLTTIQKEIWFFTKVISTVALSLFCISLLLYGVWLRKSYPGYLTISGAIINSIGCLTAFVPQVSLSIWNSVPKCSISSHLGSACLCRSFLDCNRTPHGQEKRPCQKLGDYRDTRLYFCFVLRQNWYSDCRKDGKPYGCPYATGLLTLL